ncbi:hypothetical protein PUNSTDRAFT_65413 [Punctularia strigosozonata HHB-11173 SS5]|uniref:uncharacterized protein n=1 Tax=Punctularia strigosozonata (strain HHB-11173) TaxID=741275 RepID=UPI0004418136|nr:uncharacterized protein PUNSTDRAFT_65413 [Punctularia strigosozonata HHB-11173 SS5]EIN10466.1 hypothetical protein PUNSTDRAFT_65413 [Punctularia strigosozonata HHB-11173 SS5]
MSSSVAYQAAKALQKLLPQKLPPSLSTRPGNLYEVISRYPSDGVGKIVHQTRWGTKGIEDSYWQITRSRTKLQGKHGKAWGVLFWKGKQVSPREERIRGGLKYQWAEGSSKAAAPKAPSTRIGP